MKKSLGIFVFLISLSSVSFGLKLVLERQIKGEENLGTPGVPSILDRQLQSPKSIHFSADGRKIYINALEGGRTLVYDWPELRKRKSIVHEFSSRNEALFKGQTTAFDYEFYTLPNNSRPNDFMGKPVEMAMSHLGKYLWIPYYRRSFDEMATSPSAVAIVDTDTDQIVRVIPTGPIPKYIAVSPDGERLAIVHWGDNSIGILNIASMNPDEFFYEAHLRTDVKFDLKNLGMVDRDVKCSECLRGAVFSEDSRYLVVAEMGGWGGLVGFDIQEQKYLGRVRGLDSSPRHLVLDRRGDLYVSSNKAGVVSRKALNQVVDDLLRTKGRTGNSLGWQRLRVGVGSRTIELSPDQKTLYVANNESESLVAVDTASMSILDTGKSYPYPVGLAVSPDGDHVVTTAQGRSGAGGHVVEIWRVEQ